MKIGIDFDNTIANYENAFYRAALDRGLVPKDISQKKNHVRDFLNKNNKKNAFTELQGYIYGARMDLARPFVHSLDFIKKAKIKNHEIYVVSHKSRHPIRGPKYNLHEAATNFLVDWGFLDQDCLTLSDIYFEETKEKKISRIYDLEIEIFIDDLPEILHLLDLMNNKNKILFDPGNIYSQMDFPFLNIDSWLNIAKYLEV